MPRFLAFFAGERAFVDACRNLFAEQMTCRAASEVDRTFIVYLERQELEVLSVSSRFNFIRNSR